MDSLHYSTLSKIYAPQIEISKGVEDHIEIPLPITLQGKHLISSHEAERGVGARMSQLWNRTVAGLPFNPRVSTLACCGISFPTMCEMTYSAIAGLANGPRPPPWVDVTCIGLAIGSFAIVAYRTLKMSNDPHKQINENLEWLKKNPYFLEVWEEINREEKLTFEVISKEEAGKEENYSADAWYSSSKHIITFVKTNDSDFLESMIFECCNAFQRQRFLQSSAKMGWDCLPDRNTYGIFAEQVEYPSIPLYHKIVKYGIENLEWNQRLLGYHDQETATVANFQKTYSWGNKLSAGKKVTHTEHYRLDWDRLHAPIFFLKHPEELEQHPELLHYRSDDASLLDFVLIECKSLCQSGDTKTQEEVMTALMVFLRCWYAQKEKLKILPQVRYDSMLLFITSWRLLDALQKESQIKALRARVGSFLDGDKVKEDPTFQLDLQHVTKGCLIQVDAFLIFIDQKIREEVRYAPLQPSEETPLIETEKKDNPFANRMLLILRSFSTLIQKEIQLRD